MDADAPRLPHLCVRCGRAGDTSGCAHRGKWHAAYGDCHPRCALKLGWSNLGQQHWGCCFSTDESGFCERAGHVFEEADPVVERKASLPTALFNASEVRRFRVNLDEDPGTRWTHIVEEFKHQLPAVMTMIDEVLGQGFLAGAANGVFESLMKLGRVYYDKELTGIADTVGLPKGKVAIMQVAYEVFAACTSIVTDVDGKLLDPPQQGCRPFHIRTMDWEFQQLMDLTIEVDFVRAGRTVFTATTWPGYVGVLTGVKKGVGSISVNYRRSYKGATEPVKAIVENMLRGLSSSWPVAFLVREALDKAESFEDLVGALEQSALMAPTYLTLAGPEEGQGVVITRNRQFKDTGDDPEENPPVQRLCDQRTMGGLVQANMDHWRDPGNPMLEDDERWGWQDICESVARRAVVREALATSRGSITPEDLWLLLSTPPCKAADTVYTVAMCPATGAICTRVHVTEEQALAGEQRWGQLIRRALRGHRSGAGPTRQ